MTTLFPLDFPTGRPRLRRVLHRLPPALLPLILSGPAHAHGHLDAGPDLTDGTRLALVGSSSETALFVPPGEPFSNYLRQFPGGYYASELTFSSEDPDGSRPRIELLSVAGPAGGSFGFWEVGATSPTWSRPSGWSASEGDRPSFVTYEDGTGYGHIHGRAFTATHPGDYTVVFRAVDDAGQRSAGEAKTVVFHVLATPALTLAVNAGAAELRFASRSEFTYDLQVSTDLETWTPVEGAEFVAGTGGEIQLGDAIAGRPRVFYRLVEYR